MNRSTDLLAPGDLLLGRYQLRERTGGGDHSVEYEAIDLELGRPVSVRIATYSAAADPRLAEGLRTEAREVSSLEHAGIPKMYDYGEVEGRPFLVSELVQGRRLDTLLRDREALPVGSALGIVDDVLAALQYAHERGVIHGAVHPGNVVVTREGRTRLVGFGASTAPSDHVTTAAGGHSPGARSYLAPELVAGGPATLAGDLYSTGVLLYHALTGRLPYEDETAYDLNATMDGFFEPPSTVRAGVPEQVDSVVAWALASDPSWRYHSAAEMREEIARVASEILQATSPEVAGNTQRRSLRAGLLAPFVRLSARPRASFAAILGIPVLLAILALSGAARGGEGASSSMPAASTEPAVAAAVSSEGSTPAALPALPATAEPSSTAAGTAAGGQVGEPTATPEPGAGNPQTARASAGDGEPLPVNTAAGNSVPAGGAALSTNASRVVGTTQAGAAESSVPRDPASAVVAPRQATATVRSASPGPPAPAAAAPLAQATAAPAPTVVPSAPPAATPTSPPPTAELAASPVVPATLPPTPVPPPTTVPTAVPTYPAPTATQSGSTTKPDRKDEEQTDSDREKEDDEDEDDEDKEDGDKKGRDGTPGRRGRG